MRLPGQGAAVNGQFVVEELARVARTDDIATNRSCAIRGGPILGSNIGESPA